MTTESEAELFDAIAFVYLACAKLTDGDLDRSEAQVIGAKCRELTPSLGREQTDALFREVATRFWHMPGAEMSSAVVTATNLLVARLDDARKSAVVLGLAEVTEADGKVTDSEVAYLHAIAAALGVEL